MDIPRDENGKTLEEFLQEYDVNAYEHPSVTVDMAVFTLKETDMGFKAAILLIKRRNHPSIGMYAMPGGFVEMNETIYQAAERELIEETGVTGLNFRQFGTFGDLDRDPRTRVISVGHYAVAKEGTLKICAGDDAIDAELFTFKSEKLSESEYKIMLFGSRTLSFCAKLTLNGLGYTIETSPEKALASDHDKMLFCALCSLANHKKEDIASLLASNKVSVNEAVKALEEALGQIPGCKNIGI